MSAQKGNILSAALQSGAFTDENLVNKMMAFLAAGHKPLQGQWHVQYTPISPSRQNPRLSSPSRRHNHSRHHLNARPSPYLHVLGNGKLRVYPPVSITFRKAARDTTIQETLISKGNLIILCPFAVH
ncbi:hypothetical protein MMC31_006115, partial [Peltigera leucophlebia]|nr:hypothetical protein [Peltigera leucophlebia]